MDGWELMKPMNNNNDTADRHETKEKKAATMASV
jgi:hypothetical protein